MAAERNVVGHRGRPRLRRRPKASEEIDPGHGGWLQALCKTLRDAYVRLGAYFEIRIRVRSKKSQRSLGALPTWWSAHPSFDQFRYWIYKRIGKYEVWFILHPRARKDAYVRRCEFRSP